MPLTLEPAARQEAQAIEVREIVAYATQFIDRFFRKKKPDPSYDLYEMRFVKLVINSSIVGSLHLVEECMGIELGRMTRRQRYDKVVEMYRQCAMIGIPKEFATGLLLMEYIVCKGIDILDDE